MSMLADQITVGAPGNAIPPFDNVIKAAQRNEQQGFDVVWWYDHLMSWWPQSIWSAELVPMARHQSTPHINLDAVATIAAVCAGTERIMLGTCVTDPVRRPPAVLAQEFLTLDHISKGRAILGIGSGEACNTLPYGLARDKPVSRLEEALKIVRLLWEHDDPVDFDGQFWSLRGAVVGLRPYRPGHYPPIWVAGVAPRTLKIVGRLADGWLPFNMSIEQYRSRAAIVRESSIAAGRRPDAVCHGLFCYLVIDERHEECHRMLESLLVKDLCLAVSARDFERHGAKHPLGDEAFGMNDYIPSWVDRERALELIRAVPFGLAHEVILHGSPDEIAEHLRPYVEAGVRHIALQNVTFAADWSKLSSSFRLMADAVRRIKALGPAAGGAFVFSGRTL